MKEFLIIIVAFALFVVFVIGREIRSIKQAEFVKRNHPDFKGIKQEAIEVIDGEVFVKFLDYWEFREFKKELRGQRRR